MSPKISEPVLRDRELVLAALDMAVAAFGPHAKEIMADIPNYCDLTPDQDNRPVA